MAPFCSQLYSNSHLTQRRIQSFQWPTKALTISNPPSSFISNHISYSLSLTCFCLISLFFRLTNITSGPFYLLFSPASVFSFISTSPTVMVRWLALSLSAVLCSNIILSETETPFYRNTYLHPGTLYLLCTISHFSLVYIIFIYRYLIICFPYVSNMIV